MKRLVVVLISSMVLEAGTTARLLAQDEQVAPIMALPSQIVSGAFVPPIAVRVRGAAAGQLVRAVVRPGFALLPVGDSAVTDANGIAEFRELVVWGPIGTVSLFFRAGGAVSREVGITVKPGQPRTLVVRDAPKLVATAETLDVSGSSVRVLDRGGNPVGGAEVSVRPTIIGSDSTTFGPARARLVGNTVVTTDDDGEAQFTTLKLLGQLGLYRLNYSVLVPGDDGSQVEKSSQPFVHNPDRNSNQSFVVVSAIKSIGGRTPADEFFDLRFRFRYSSRLFGLAQVDFALSGTGDSVRSSQRLLTEASVSFNRTFQPFADFFSGRVERALFVGPTAVVFNTLPYAGLQVGSIEHAGSAFQGSSMVVAMLRRLSGDTNFVDGDTLVAAGLSIYGGFFLRSSTIPFFKTLNLRAGIILPLDRRTGLPRRLDSRLVVSVPLGTIDFF